MSHKCDVPTYTRVQEWGIFTLEVNIPVLSEEVFSGMSHHAVCVGVLFRFSPSDFETLTLNTHLSALEINSRLSWFIHG